MSKSSVLVKGMEMPKDCSTCPCFQYNMFDDEIDGYCKALKTKITYSDERHPNCSLIEVPTPHGRLIDKTKLKRDLFVNFMGERIPFYDCDNFPTTLTYIDLHSILSEQPTVIESED